LCAWSGSFPKLRAAKVEQLRFAEQARRKNKSIFGKKTPQLGKIWLLEYFAELALKIFKKNTVKNLPIPDKSP